MMRTHRQNKNHGMSLVEGVVYIGVLAIVAALFMLTAVSFFQSFVEVRASRAVSAAARTALERIVRETRAADGIRDVGSVFDSDNGTLSLDTEGGSIVDFYIENDGVVMRTDGGASVALTEPSIVVEMLRFHKLANSESVGVQTLLSIRDARVHATTTTEFNGAALVRASY